MSRRLDTYAGYSVLVVDDNASNVLFVTSLLQQQGLERVYSVTDPRRVAAELVDKRPDLVLLDLHMPHLDGFEVLTQIQSFAAGRYLPVLVLTADTTTTARNRALEQGAQDFLVKPLDAVEAVLRVANLLETVQLYSTLRQQAVQQPTSPDLLDDPEETRARIESVIRDRSIAMVYQPIVDIRDMTVVGHEALARFPGAGRGGPDTWFADAARVGLGIELEWLAVSSAIAEFPPTAERFLAVNLSPAAVLAVTHSHVLPEEMFPNLVIELTEHDAIEDYVAIHRALAPIRAAGARVAADDLGSGYAGFRHLIRLQPDIIKLDITLVSGIQENTGQRALARALATFASEVGARVIAEGVEEADELGVLQELGVTWAQGYLLGRPQPIESSR